MSVDNIITRAMSEIPKCVAAGVVDLDDFNILASKFGVTLAPRTAGILVGKTVHDDADLLA